MSIEFAFKYFEKIEIIYPNFDTNIKIINYSKNNNNENKNVMNQPQIFNLFVPFKSLVSISLILRTNILDMETTNYEKDFTGYEKINPAMICYSKYDPDNQTFKYFDGAFNSLNISMALLIVLKILNFPGNYRKDIILFMLGFYMINVMILNLMNIT